LPCRHFRERCPLASSVKANGETSTLDQSNCLNPFVHLPRKTYLLIEKKDVCRKRKLCARKEKLQVRYSSLAVGDLPSAMLIHELTVNSTWFFFFFFFFLTQMKGAFIAKRARIQRNAQPLVNSICTHIVTFIVRLAWPSRLIIQWIIGYGVKKMEAVANSNFKWSPTWQFLNRSTPTKNLLEISEALDKFEFHVELRHFKFSLGSTNP
jgi:hypothetical protein